MSVQQSKIYFTEYQEWVRVEGKRARVGLTPAALKELEEIVYVELPKLGVTIHQGECAVVIETTKAAIDLYAPLSGTIVQINRALVEKPQLINESPQKLGWIYEMEFEAVDQLEALTTH